MTAALPAERSFGPAPAPAPPGFAAPRSVAVVVCAYTLDRWSDLGAAVASVQGQSCPPDQTIVVIDHNDELLARALEAFPGALVVANGRTRGLSGARNTALDRATTDVVAFLDDDAVAAPTWLARLLAAFADDVLAVGGLIRPRWSEGRPRWFPEEFDWVVGCSWKGLPAESSEVRNVIGAGMAFRRSVFEAVGAFDEHMGRIGRVPLGCEETELCIRARQWAPAAEIRFEPGARVDHRVSADRNSLRYFVRRCWAEGLSKAQVSGSVGSADGLSQERAYTSTVLPAGVARGFRDAAAGDPWGLARATAIVAGLGATATGYVAGRVRAR